MTTSTDGVSWTPAQSVTAGGTGVDHFLPGIGASPATAGRLALVFHSSPTTAPTFRRRGDRRLSYDVEGRRLHVDETAAAHRRASIVLDSIARTRIGLMLADYVSTSFVRGRPVSVFVLAVVARERPLPASDVRLPLGRRRCESASSRAVETASG